MINKHNIAFSAADHLFDIVKSMFPNSDIAAKPKVYSNISRHIEFIQSFNRTFSIWSLLHVHVTPTNEHTGRLCYNVKHDALSLACGSRACHHAEKNCVAQKITDFVSKLLIFSLMITDLCSGRLASLQGRVVCA